MNVLIIEDEIKTAKELKGLIEAIDSDIKIVDILHSVNSAIQWFKEHPSPDLIFSDIQLGDGLSFDIYRNVQVNTPVIFCTAFDEYAIRAFEANGIDYLLKPIDEGMLEQSLRKYQHFKNLFNNRQDLYQQKLIKLVGQMDTKYKQSILVYFKEKIIPIKTSEIRFIYAEHGLVYIHSNFDRFITQHTVEQLEAMLNPQLFFKANRQFIINRDNIQNVEHYFNRRLFVKLNCETPEKIIVSKIKANDFLQWMED
ncbi:LytR/AlgR family response regulator transcription factor [Mucilaginibacter lappiensis]|uniref:DNA-binding LytR/AlgR family response regulator n=1 Tax=Mucilaginibacter lappiensis TaxID=354630 RepID=A0A1N7BY45_9SPHI|nr:LytTR family DNA-binding domain-containing protein [Mucilaginibacter lappiensis]MBB6109976.1 DNA-binding LytR/AlgR family response regulator [Mucilaginibacter lappiensis]MBB6126690.1 DNA-binding LytR/AlgR family response regulator [Mucilaginibacter lappiensis]SIR56268.1 two component transcriptional regulator, LytTR family [Mucilaginibacter lappiensis]